MQVQLINTQRKKELEHDIRCADLKIDVDYYIKLCTTVAFLASLVLTYFFSSIVDFEMLPLLFVLMFALIYLLSLRIPKLLARNRALKIESELPVQLRALSTELAIGVPFEEALESVAHFGQYTGHIFTGILRDIKNGIPPADAFNRARSSVDSRMLDKALSHLAFIYSYGYEESGLSKLVEEMSNEHSAKMKEYASRSSMMGVLLITVTSVVPALATTYILVGSSFMDISLGAVDIIVMYTIVLPLAALVLLLATRMLLPAVSKKGSDFLSEQELMRFTVFLGKLGINMHAVNFLAYLAVSSVIASIAVYLLTNSPLSFAIMLVPLFVYGMFLYLEDMRISSIEEHMPDALFYAASLHNLGLEKVVGEIAKANYGELSREFGRINRQIDAGFSISAALSSFIDRNRSPITERGISLLMKIHEVGTSLEKTLRSTAEDIHDMFMLMRERASVLSMQMYNLLVACLLVPAIFGAVLSLVESLDLSYIETLLSVQSSRNLLTAVTFSINIYLFEFAVLGSIFLADYSGSWKRFAVYLVFLLPIMFSIFYIVQIAL
ncbi:MAG: type II secretion system F family protein [Candidatus Micrarchaeia archaeon]